MEILPLPSSNEPITNVVRYLSQPPVIVQKAMAGQARAPWRARSTAVGYFVPQSLSYLLEFPVCAQGEPLSSFYYIQ